MNLSYFLVIIISWVVYYIKEIEIKRVENHQKLGGSFKSYLRLFTIICNFDNFISHELKRVRTQSVDLAWNDPVATEIHKLLFFPRQKNHFYCFSRIFLYIENLL